MPTPTELASAPRRRGPRRPARRCRCTPSAPGSVASRACGQHPPVRVDQDARASWSRRCRARSAVRLPSLIGPTLPPAARRRPRRVPAGTSRARRSAAAAVVAGPASPTRRRPRCGPPPGPAHRTTAGCRCASRTWTTRGPSGSSSYATSTRSTGSPQGTSPTAMVPGESTRTTRAPRRSGSSPSTVTARAAPSRSEAGSSPDRWSRRTGRGSAGDPRRRVGQPLLGQPARRGPRPRSRPGPRAPARRRRRPSPGRPEAEQVAARGEREDRGLRDPAAGRRARHVEGVADDDAREAQVVRAAGRATAALSVAGESASQADTTTCEVMTAAAPALTADRERHAAPGRPGRRRAASTRGSARWLSRSVSPWPGQCLTQAATPVSCRPSVQAATCVATSDGSAPKLRVPMTGLSAPAVDVRDRRQGHRDPERRQLGPDVPADRPGEVGKVVAAPRARAPSTGLPSLRVQPGDVAALLVDRDDRAGSTRADRGERGHRVRAVGGVGAVEAHPAEARVGQPARPVAERGAARSRAAARRSARRASSSESLIPSPPRRSGR